MKKVNKIKRTGLPKSISVSLPSKSGAPFSPKNNPGSLLNPGGNLRSNDLNRLMGRPTRHL
jgi:hypothetical protein